MRYQLPVAVERNNVGLIVVDSIAANFRAEFDLPAKRIKSRPGKTPNSGAMNMAMRGKQLVGLARGLKELARRFGLAVVVANQVADRFPRGWADADDLSLLDYQSRYFTGWEEVDGGKVPALGMVWANLLGGRNALLKGEERDGRPRTRNIMVVFSECAQGGKKVEFEIWEGGVRGVKKEKGEEKTTIYG